MIDALRRHSVGILVGLAAALAVAILGSLGLAALAGLGTLLTGGSVLSAVLPVLAVAVAFAAAEAAVVVGLVWLLVRRVRRTVRLPRDERLARPLRRAEERIDALAALGISDRVAPDPAERRAEVREQYVAGEIDEREFERRMERLLAADTDEVSTHTTGETVPDSSGDTGSPRQPESERAG